MLFVSGMAGLPHHHREQGSQERQYHLVSFSHAPAASTGPMGPEQRCDNADLRDEGYVVVVGCAYSGRGGQFAEMEPMVTPALLATSTQCGHKDQ
jgi:hypothetical protein